MKKKQLYTVDVPAVSRDFATELSRRFPVKEVKPGVTLEELQYNAGQRSVIDFIIAMSSGTLITSDVNQIRPTQHTQSLLSKLLGNLKK